MSKLLDYYGEFARRVVQCRDCGWSGKGGEMESGETFGDGVDKHCPACGERWGFVQWSVVVPQSAPSDWRAKIERAPD